MSALIIDNVDLNMLELQRKRLVEIVLSDLYEQMTLKQQDAITGILNMLDAWSDSRD